MNTMPYFAPIALALLLLADYCGQVPVTNAQTISEAYGRRFKVTDSGPVKLRTQLVASSEETSSAGQLRPQELAQSDARDTSEDAELAGEDPVTRAARIKLMGAKALAEFKADKLGKRVEGLEQGLKEKDEELTRLRAEAKEKEGQVHALTRQVQELQSVEQTRSSQVEAALTDMKARLAERADESKRLKKQLGDSQELLAALKTAVADSSRLKEEAEAHLAKLNKRIKELQGQASQAYATAEQYKQEYLNLSAQMKQTTKDLGQCREAAKQSKEQLAKTKAQVEQLTETAEYLESDRNRYVQEIQTLRSQVKNLRTKIPTGPPRAEIAEEDAASPMETILQVTPAKKEPPKPAKTQGSPMNLYY
ncbi:MAG: hypothetical protein AB1646_13475 [Thermodesulfobacteriota bacterium]